MGCLKNNKVTIVSQFNGCMIKKGQKFKSEKSLLAIARLLKKKNKKPFYNLLLDSANKVKPFVGLFSKKVGSATYKIPISIGLEKEFSTGVSWIVKEPCGWKKGNFVPNIYSELTALLSKNGGSKSLRKKIELHRLAESNRVYLKYIV